MPPKTTIAYELVAAANQWAGLSDNAPSTQDNLADLYRKLVVALTSV